VVLAAEVTQETVGAMAVLQVNMAVVVPEATLVMAVAKILTAAAAVQAAVGHIAQRTADQVAVAQAHLAKVLPDQLNHIQAAKVVLVVKMA
jgi:hypothetical protein